MTDSMRDNVSPEKLGRVYPVSNECRQHVGTPAVGLENAVILGQATGLNPLESAVILGPSAARNPGSILSLARFVGPSDLAPVPMDPGFRPAACPRMTERDEGSWKAGRAMRTMDGSVPIRRNRNV